MSSSAAYGTGERPEGGRFDFNDGGSFVGEWSDGRAHGLGVATGPDDNPGEYSGEWMLGFESLGVYIWPTGSMYEGRWAKGKRHGEGVQLQGNWRYKGEFTTGFYGRYGVRESLINSAKYEGSWNLNQFDGFGIETNADGSTYAGGWTKGLRSGLGVRRSVPYGLAGEFHTADTPSRRPTGGSITRISESNENNVTSIGMSLENVSRQRRLDEHKNGFVLTGWPSNNMGSHANSHPQSRHPPTNISISSSLSSTHPKKSLLEKSSSLLQIGFIKKLRKQKSAGDLSLQGGSLAFRNGRGGGSLRSTTSSTSQATNYSAMSLQPPTSANPLLNLPSSPQSATSSTYTPSIFSCNSPELVIDPNVIETYFGQWLDDKRMGYGVAERSDGLRYEGEWLNNRKNGYGCTYFPDGSKEEGRYRNNVLVSILNRKAKLMVLRGSRTRDCVDAAIAKAKHMGKEALTKAQESANQRANTARMAAISAENAATEARRASLEARSVSYELAPEFVQPGPSWCPAAVKSAHSGDPQKTRLLNSSSTMKKSQNTSYKAPSDTSQSSRSRGLQRSVATRDTHTKSSFEKQSSLNDSVMERPTTQFQGHLTTPGISSDATSSTNECLEISGGSRQGSFRSRKPRSKSSSGSQKGSREASETTSIVQPRQRDVDPHVPKNAPQRLLSSPEPSSSKPPVNNVSPISPTTHISSTKFPKENLPSKDFPSLASPQQSNQIPAKHHVPISEIDDRFDYYWEPVRIAHIIGHDSYADSTDHMDSKRDSGVGGETYYMEENSPSSHHNVTDQGASRTGTRIHTQLPTQIQQSYYHQRGDSSDTHDSGMSDVSQISKDSRTATRKPNLTSHFASKYNTSSQFSPTSSNTTAATDYFNPPQGKSNILSGLGIDAERSKVIIENGLRKRVLEETERFQQKNRQGEQRLTSSKTGAPPQRYELSQRTQTHSQSSTKRSQYQRLSDEDLRIGSTSSTPRSQPEARKRNSKDDSLSTAQKSFLPSTPGEFVLSWGEMQEWLHENILVMLVLALNVVLVVAFISIMRDKSHPSTGAPRRQ